MLLENGWITFSSPFPLLQFLFALFFFDWTETEKRKEKDSFLIWSLEHLSAQSNSAVHINRRPNSHHSNLKTRKTKLLDKVCFPLWDASQAALNPVCSTIQWVTGALACPIPIISAWVVRCVPEDVLLNIFTGARRKCQVCLQRERLRMHPWHLWETDGSLQWRVMMNLFGNSVGCAKDNNNKKKPAGSETCAHARFCSCMCTCRLQKKTNQQANTEYSQWFSLWSHFMNYSIALFAVCDGMNLIRSLVLERCTT